MELAIDLNALKENVSLVKKLTGKKLILPVKANAYGHGIKEVVGYMKDHCDGFWTANKEEALTVRSVGGKKVLVACTKESDHFELLRNDVEICINDKGEFLSLLKTSEKMNVKAKVHISMDTSMKRMGFSADDDLSFLNEFKNRVNFCGIYTHLARSDAFFIDRTLSRFLPFVKKIRAYAGTYIPMHIFASEAVERLIQNKANICGKYVRTGLLCYGISQLNAIDVKQVIKVYSTVLAVTEVKKGDSVGYGGKYVAQCDGWCITGEGGYFDGILPSFIGGYVEICSKRCKIVAICMDCFMVFSETYRPQKGEKIVIFDEKMTVKDEARRQNKIPYQILTSFQGRTKRIYEQGSGENICKR